MVFQKTSRSCAAGGCTRGQRASFTLIELLVVVAIIGLLVSILLPSLGAARETARKVKCMAELRGISHGLLLYAGENQQTLPDYKTVGKHYFRIAPGKQLTMPIPHGSGLSPYPECFGIQAVLHTGSGPHVMPNKVGIGKSVENPMYFPGDSKAWLCPSNPGPSDRPDWKAFGASYVYVAKTCDDDPNRARDVDHYNWEHYNIEYLTLHKEPNMVVFPARLYPLMWDNYSYYPGDNGLMGPFDRYTIAPLYRQAPHRVPRFNAPIEDAWIGIYLDGHVQMNGLNHPPKDPNS